MHGILHQHHRHSKVSAIMRIVWRAGADCSLPRCGGAGVAGGPIWRRRRRVLPRAAGQGRSAKPRSCDGHLDSSARPPVLGVCAVTRAGPAGGESSGGAAEDGHTTAASWGDGWAGEWEEPRAAGLLALLVRAALLVFPWCNCLLFVRFIVGVLVNEPVRKLFNLQAMFDEC